MASQSSALSINDNDFDIEMQMEVTSQALSSRAPLLAACRHHLSHPLYHHDKMNPIIVFGLRKNALSGLASPHFMILLPKRIPGGN
jgi:hypothetical protein